MQWAGFVGVALERVVERRGEVVQALIQALVAAEQV